MASVLASNGWFEKFKRKHKQRQKTVERDLDFLDSDFFYFLKFIFERDKVDKNTLMKKRRLSEDKFGLFENMAISKRYVALILGRTKEYKITHEGIDFLLNFRRNKKKESYEGWVMAATIVLAISAGIQAIDIWVNRDTTKEFISTGWNNLLIGFFKFIGGLIQIVVVVLIIWGIYKFVKFLMGKKEKLIPIPLASPIQFKS